MPSIRPITALLALVLAPACLIKRVDDKAFELRGAAAFVELEAGWICPGNAKGLVTTLASEPERTVTTSVPTTHTTTYGSCSDGHCTHVTTETTTPMTVTRVARKRVRVDCP
ncbi:MAG: hypothetical protein K1X88_18015 [Nannocystaceae bacterium]|nr:hypothetical protein [Nannocystaceae bacterium]